MALIIVHMAIFVAICGHLRARARTRGWVGYACLMAARTDTVTISRAEYEAFLADRARAAEVPALRAELVELKAQLSHYQTRLDKLQQQLLSLVRQRFGSSSENSKQLSLFGVEDVEVIEQPTPDAPIAPKPKAAPERQRLVLPKGLPEERIEIDLPASDKLAADGTPLVRFGEEVTVKLGFRPAQFFKRLIVRPQYADPRRPEDGVKCAALPPQLVDGSLLEAGLASWLVVSKYADHLPLYRLAEIGKRSGIVFPRSTLSDWVLTTCNWLAPLFDRLRELLLKQGVIHVDETMLPLQSVGRTIKARAWAYVGRDPKIVLYDFSLDKAGAHVRTFLRDWSGGHLQADAASNFDALFLQRPEIREVGCWAHARRKFFDIAVAADKTGTRVLAHEAIEMIGELFAIEREAQSLTAEKRQAMRQERAEPKLAALKDWCEQQRDKVLPKSPTSGAIQYLLKRWDVFTRYIEDGHIAIDNNAAERALREIAVGRKNWLFAGSEQGGHACTIATSLIETAKAHDLDPQAYLTDILTRLPTTLNKDIDQLLPMNWTPAVAAG